MEVGDLIEFKHSSVGVTQGSKGLITGKTMQKRMERPTHNVQSSYIIYDIQTFDGRSRRFTDRYLELVSAAG
jgi:hypothetical protein